MRSARRNAGVLADWRGGVLAAEWEACAADSLPANVEGLAVRRRDAAGPAGETPAFHRTMLSGATLAPVQSALHSAGPQAARIEHLWWVFFWICVVVYVITIVFFLIAAVRGRRRADAIDNRAHDRRLGFFVSSCAAVTIATLFGLLFSSVATGNAIGTFGKDKPGQIEIEVTGHQWWWEVKYPDSLLPSNQITDANEIHIPIHTPVLLRLDTRDVIHSLWIPNLHGKRDLIPGRVNKFWIQADTPGVYRGQCAEFCGYQHAHMALTVVAESSADFLKWKSHMGEGAPTPMTPSQLRGQQVFLNAPCAKCHNILGLDAYGTLGPDLTHFRSRPTLAAGQLLNTRGNLAGWIANAPAIKPGTLMPPNQLSGQEMNDLLAYLETLR
ncbi:MAG: cytochrome c oxidase subunit [Thermoanaerobaculia bacterium]|nr:cytochrome c oxidase subunit [Thermoanaerobaculia bacterium]MEA2417768.1 cytochrome c oxidase subunit [Thermoanaerobaculia bacterium]